MERRGAQWRLRNCPKVSVMALPHLGLASSVGDGTDIGLFRAAYLQFIECGWRRAEFPLRAETGTRRTFEQ